MGFLNFAILHLGKPNRVSSTCAGRFGGSANTTGMRRGQRLKAPSPSWIRLENAMASLASEAAALAPEF